MGKSLIKPSRRGLLHKHLGIPAGEKIGRDRLLEAKRSDDPAIRKEANFALNFNHNGHHGEVVSIGAHHSDPNLMRVEIAHGKKKKPPKAKKGQAVPSYYDDRPTSSLVVPKNHARRYRIGQKVGVGTAPLDGDAAGDGDGDGGDMEDAMDDFNETRRGITSYKGKRY